MPLGVDVEHPIPGLDRDLADPGVRIYAGIVDQHLHLAERLKDGIPRLNDLRLLGDVGGICARRATLGLQFGYGLLTADLVDVRNADRCATPRKQRGNGESNARGPARDHRHLAGELALRHGIPWEKSPGKSNGDSTVSAAPEAVNCDY